MKQYNSVGYQPEPSALNSPKKILIVDDDALIRLGLEKLVKKEGYLPFTAGSGKAALKKLEQEPPDIVLLDLKLPDSLDGMTLLEHIKKTQPEVTVIMISGQSELRGAVDAMKAGALDYLEKPIDFDRLKELLKSIGPKEVPERGEQHPDNFIFASDKMKKVVQLMERLALRSDITILVQGESGTGKNFLCRKMHQLSPRKDAPYVQIGCANIPDHLIESELFGYEKGAFTDAKHSKRGLVEMAEGGTVLLDELGEMPYAFQSKVLTLIDEKRFRRVGGLHDTTVDVRILAATNKNLAELVQAKKFRLDLFYRINVATIELPPLRERLEDIPIMVKGFLDSFCSQYNCEPKSVTDEAMKLLLEYGWPGNVRQLKNLMERLVVLTDSEVIDTAEVSPLLLTQERPAATDEEAMEMFAGVSLAEMERRHIKNALALAGGNQRKAAQLLNITRDTLRYRLKKLDLA